MKIKQGMVLTNEDGDKIKILAVCGEAVLRSLTNDVLSAGYWQTVNRMYFVYSLGFN